MTNGAQNDDSPVILDLGWELPDSEYVERAEFQRADSFSEYQHIFVDPLKIETLWADYLQPAKDGYFLTEVDADGGLGKALLNIIRTRQEEISKLLRDRGGMVFVRLREPGRPVRILKENEQTLIHRYSWIPGFGEVDDSLDQLGLRRRRGKGLYSIETSAGFLTDYCSHNQSDFRYEVVLEDTETHKKEMNLTPLAYNSVGEPVAFQLSWGRGRVMFLPSLLGEKRHEAHQNLLNKVAERARFDSDGPPSWISDFDAPEEQRLASDLEELNSRRGKIRDRIEDLQEQLEECGNYKKLLYSTNPRVLREIAGKVFRELGFRVEMNSFDSADFVLSGEDRTALVIIGAAEEDPVGLEPYRRLLWAADSARPAEDDLQGVLLANGYAEKHPEERSRTVTEEVRRRCSLNNFTFLSTFQLFEYLVCLNRGEGKKVKRQLMELIYKE